MLDEGIGGSEGVGWWDGEGIARDYFVAVNPKGVHLWIYCNRRRDRDHEGWYLHGIFA